MTWHVSDAERRARLVAGHRLDSPGRSDDDGRAAPLVVARALVALHSSDPVSVYLSVLARSSSSTVDDVAAALYDDRELVRVHGMRRTLWVADVETGADIVAASAARLERAERRRLATFLGDAGIDEPIRWIDDACAEIHQHVLEVGPVDTRSIGEALPHLSVGFDVAGGKRYAATISAHTRILLILGYSGRIVRADPKGTWIASQYRWVDPVAWVGRPLAGGAGGDTGSDAAGEDRTAQAQTAVIDRYVRAFGPVTTDDVVWWTGWPKGAVVRALETLEVTGVDLDAGNGWLAADEPDVEPDPKATEESVALLPGLDPTVMGWKQRDHYLDPAMADRLFDRNGNAGPTIWIGGRIVGGWAQRDDGELVHELLTDVGSDARRAIDSELERLEALLGETRYKVRFPNPLNTELRS